jgi:hypothetical protein
LTTQYRIFTPLPNFVFHFFNYNSLNSHQSPSIYLITVCYNL